LTVSTFETGLQLAVWLLPLPAISKYFPSALSFLVLVKQLTNIPAFPLKFYRDSV